ncbi:M16 family metallopeptidase [Mucilaginibacter phyllosphaerae]|uniref:Insulinase family protein n=1 Tax=Mucilaginibacter phyllosphaerae TaxID=1812349 RepID=A0A4Y8ACV9_9SPHI|nr:M16 family metallopeptidase [Mucilaginibacter phyllosphaerae]MBB3970054.1 zinc protease [Mucilaginibacter phyllosphaerae]TEW66446.1 insulinase family protein [Mucilaginibacter phyllosphaerae]GGH09458.1 peptidase M16 [Mucilaginibacter phyllosphaerae]
MAAIFAISALCCTAQNKANPSLTKVARKIERGQSNQLPLDAAVRTGKLANGFTYFIRRNTNPKNRVIFYLANKIGSLMETTDQQGLAHFMEHMNFNGTTHFPKNELVNYLQKAGVRFGADINAYTSFDETVYQLPLPSDKPDILRGGIQIMRDWAQGATLDPAEIEKERGVVLEEKRLGKGAAQRMQQKYFPVLFGNSRYGQRLPIGMDTVLNNFKPNTLTRFYHDWYRPDLQALIVVGDIDVNEIEKAIKQKFADLKNPVKEKPRTKYVFTLTGSNHFVKATDPEETSTQVQVLIKRQARPVKTADDYREMIIRKLFNHMLGNRYLELAQQKQPPFIYGGANVGAFLGNIDAFTMRVVANPGALENGFKAVWRETERLKQYGFTATEFEKAKRDYLKNSENTYKQKHTTYSEQYMGEYLAYFLTGTAAPGIEKEYKLTNTIMPQLLLKDVNAVVGRFNSDSNRDIIITGPDRDSANLPDEQIVNEWIRSIRQENILPYKNSFTEKALLTSQPVPGKIVKQTELGGIKATELTLSNGVKAILKPTKFSDNDILVKAVAPGGSSLYSDADYESANIAAYLVTSSGLGSYDFNNLNKFLAGTSIATGPFLADYSQGIQAAASPAELETLLQMFYLYFTAPRKDSIAFEKYISESKASLADRKNSPENRFYDTISTVLGNYSSRRTPPSPEKLNQLDLDKSYNIFRKQFADAANFTFTFVGDFEIDKVKPLIEKYLGSLPATYTHERAKDLGIHPPAGNITKIIEAGREPKATVSLKFTGDYDYSYANNLEMDAMAEVLQIRLIERLREQESGVYSPGVNVRYNKIPSARYVFSISFGCAPANVEKLIASALDEVGKIKTVGPTAINIEKFKAERSRTHETQLRANDFWSEYLNDNALNEGDVYAINDFSATMEKITPESIKSKANKYLSGNNLIKIILLPEKSTGLQ